MRQRPRRGVRGAKKNSIRNGAQAEKKIRVTPLEGRANQAEARAKTRSGKGNHRNGKNGQDIKGDEMESGVSDGVQRTSRRRCAGASSDVELSNMARMLGLQAGQVDSWGALPEWYPDYLPSPPE